MRDFYYLCAPNFKIKNYGGSSILQLPVWIADMATGWLAGQAARDFTPTDMSTLNGINIEESSMSCWERHLRNDADSFLGVFNNFIISQLIKVD